MYTLTKKGSINADCGVIRKNETISNENYNTLSKRQKAFFVKFVEPVPPVDELKALEKANAVLEKKIADLQKINSVFSSINSAEKSRSTQEREFRIKRKSEEINHEHDQ